MTLLIVDWDRLERFRVAEGLLKCELAAKAGIHPNQIGRIRKGQPVGLRVARSLAKLLRIRVGEMTRLVVQGQGSGGVTSALAS